MKCFEFGSDFVRSRSYELALVIPRVWPDWPADQNKNYISQKIEYNYSGYYDLLYREQNIAKNIARSGRKQLLQAQLLKKIANLQMLVHKTCLYILSPFFEEHYNKAKTLESMTSFLICCFSLFIQLHIFTFLTYFYQK